jgi:hypothetical protein
MDLLAGTRTVLRASKLELEAVKRLYEREYFKRMWIVQEVCKARSLVIHCGRKRSDKLRITTSPMLTLLKATVQDWGMSNHRTDASIREETLVADVHKPIAALLTMQARTQGVAVTRGALAFIEAILLSSKAKASNPRDKLYGLLSLVSDGLLSSRCPITQIVHPRSS